MVTDIRPKARPSRLQRGIKDIARALNPYNKVAAGVRGLADGLGKLDGDYRPDGTGQMETGNNAWNLGMRAEGQPIGDFLMQQLTAEGMGRPDMPRVTGQYRGDPNYAGVNMRDPQALMGSMAQQGQRNLQQQQQARQYMVQGQQPRRMGQMVPQGRQQSRGLFGSGLYNTFKR